jgi:phosphatidylglycerophosphatase A
MKVVKESSDELNPAVVTTAFVGRAPRERSLRDYAALAIATCGVGLIPLAPGTWGSLVGVGLYLVARAASVQAFVYAKARGWSTPPLESLHTTLVLSMLIVMTIAGIWAASRCESLLARKDPGAVVVDEVIGQLLTFVFLPAGIGAWAIVVGFVTFRVFDIWKPYPIRRLESLEAGLGIMADDVLAGVYAATFMSLLTTIYLLF